jgi:hypothetical protein
VRERNKGGREKQMTKATYICRSAKKKVVTYFLLLLYCFLSIFFKGVFWAFRNKGSSKTRKKKKIEKVHAHHKKCGFFFFSLGCFVRFFLTGDWLIPGFSRPTAEKERRAGGGSGFLGSWVGGPKTSAIPPVSSPIGPRAPPVGFA